MGEGSDAVFSTTYHADVRSHATVHTKFLTAENVEAGIAAVRSKFDVEILTFTPVDDPPDEVVFSARVPSVSGDVGTDAESVKHGVCRAFYAALPAGGPPTVIYSDRVPLSMEYFPRDKGAVIYFIHGGKKSCDEFTRDVEVAPGITLSFYEDGRLFAMVSKDATRVMSESTIQRLTNPENRGVLYPLKNAAASE